MSMLILTNKKLKGKWRIALVSLYALHVVVFIGLIYLNKNHLINGNRLEVLFISWFLIVGVITIIEWQFRKQVRKNPLKYN